jgi:antitoxin Phd
VAWQIQEAKARFSELVQKAIDDGPQTITRRGKDVAVVLSAEQFELMKKRQVDFKELLAAAPLEGVDLERDKSMPREFEW